MSGFDAHNDPIADPRALVHAGNARFTVLTPQLIRLEYDEHGVFEDRASMVVINRRLPVPSFRTRHRDGWLHVETDALRLRYRIDGGAFDSSNMAIELATGDRRVVWTPDAPSQGNLRGTTRTLDFIDGRCELEQGLASRDGWALVDDSTRCVFTDGDPPWATPRENPDSLDWYFFGHGHEFAKAVHDFTRIAGRVPLPPRAIFGSWWSRYWAYSDAEFRDLVQQFREHDVPLDVLVVDMDWHLPGWTGYTWNPKYFPDHRDFLTWCKQQGLTVTLNLHPADGLGRHESQFEDFARGMGLDPRTVERIPFDCADPKYMRLYFELLHHPYERDGVDFWWLDWQQERVTKIPNLDPLRWLNHLHWTDMQRSQHRADRRPLIFSRWGGLGNHRYQIGFSGDTYSTWESLKFQPEFTSTAANVGYGYWSHDIGGHLPGPVEGELYVRWIQLGAMSPILRTHTTQHADAERRIWAFDDDLFQAARKAFHLRQRLVPYIYGMARKCHDTAIPLCRPLYWTWPMVEEAYAHPTQFMFGDDLLVAPVCSPVDKVTGKAMTEIWLPPGDWINWFTGETQSGPAKFATASALDEFPLYARAGAIIPAFAQAKPLSQMRGCRIVLHCMPGDGGMTRLYEDDGESTGYQHDECAWTTITQRREATWVQVVIERTMGEFSAMSRSRQFEIRIAGCARPLAVTGNGRAVEAASSEGDPGWRYETALRTLIVNSPEILRNERLRIEVRT